jgi:hypothetical protein
MTRALRTSADRGGVDLEEWAGFLTVDGLNAGMIRLYALRALTADGLTQILVHVGDARA